MARESAFGAEPEQLRELLSFGLEDSSEQEAAPTASLNVFMEMPGGEIGRYKLFSVLGEGGMGIVYLAEQKQPIRRQVALKVIKPGMDSKRVIARFEAERQALALLDHPNIAHVYDAGTTENGRPYFVMEYVKGLSLTEHCDRHKLAIEDRLNLFRQVCHAVHHAHQKGIIHRDIKPSNILVSLQDDQAVPKIIDFGVAKALAQPLTERTLVTEQGQLFGTPEYMSPEQADMANEDIDTRSDIYSLGVLLYVLLTGVLPFDSTTFREGGIEHIRQVIRETDPKTPSTRLTKLGEEATKVAEKRRTDVAALAKCLHRELEWIPLKAMRKERAERYRSASEFADDIENYLKGAPLLAGPTTTVYRLKKFVRRNSVLSTAILAVAATLILGLSATTAMYLRAEQQSKISEAVSGFLREDLLASVSPTRAMGREVTVRSFLDTAAENLEAKFKDEPLVEASIRDTLGNTYRHLGDFEVAELHLERACQLHQEQLGLEDPRTLNSMSGLMWIYFSQGRHIKAEELAFKAFEVKRRILGEEDEDTLDSMDTVGFAYMKLGRYREAESLYLKSLKTRRRMQSEEHVSTISTMNKLARLYSKQGRYKEAELLYDKVLDPKTRMQGEEHPFTLVSMVILARVYGGQGRYGEAERLCRRVLEVEHRVVGEEHLYTLECMSELGCVHIAQNHYKEAESLFNKALEIAHRRLRGGHPLTLRFVNGFAVVHTNLKHYDQAETFFNEALKGRQHELGNDHPETLETINDFGVLRREQKNYEEAEELLRQALDGRQHKLGPDHPACFESMHELAVLYKEQGDYDKAEPLLLQAIEGRRLKLGETHPHTLESWHNLIELYEAWGKPEKAKEWREADN